MKNNLLVAGLIITLFGCVSKPDICFSALECADKVTYRIQNHLYLNEDHIGKRAVVKIKLDDHTNIEQIIIVENNAGQGFEKAIIEAVSMAFPYEALLALPEHEYEKIKSIKLTVTPYHK